MVSPRVLDSRRKLRPALVAMLACDDELRVSERYRRRCARMDFVNALKRIGVSRHARPHELFCLLFVLREVRTIGQLTDRHTNLLSLLPGSPPKSG